MRKKLVLLLPLLLIIASCSTLPTAKMQPPVNEVMSWQQRQQQLTNIDQWRINGRIAVRTPEKSGSADVTWHQQRPKQNYHITIFGVLGVSMLEVISTPYQVEMIDSNNQRLTANDAETLLYKDTGWHIPVNALYYWIRGLPAPGSSANIAFDQYNHPKTLKQFGWTIQYLKYGSVESRIDLPTLIRVSNENISIKLFIHYWKI